MFLPFVNILLHVLSYLIGLILSIIYIFFLTGLVTDICQHVMLLKSTPVAVMLMLHVEFVFVYQ